VLVLSVLIFKCLFLVVLVKIINFTKKTLIPKASFYAYFCGTLSVVLLNLPVILPLLHTNSASKYAAV
jgi:hypothetical protein